MANEMKWIRSGVQVKTEIGGKAVILPAGGGGPVAYCQVEYADLIASAPLLYEALLEAYAYMEGEHSYDHPTCEQIRAALAAARGEKGE
jgi:hypothetical protein